MGLSLQIAQIVIIIITEYFQRLSAFVNPDIMNKIIGIVQVSILNCYLFKGCHYSCLTCNNSLRTGCLSCSLNDYR
jgi:hypothetical protein